MSSLALGSETARGEVRGRSLTSALADHGTDLLLGVAVGAFAIALLVAVPRDFSVDSWLALVTGREVWQSGIPHQNLLTAIGYGHRWTDEQWLSQLASYAIFRLGGLGLLGALNVALIIGPIGAAVAVARRRGASFCSVLVALALCCTLISPARQIRTQEFAIPLFVATAYLLSFDSRTGAGSRRVYWCLPILAVWANLHGSVTLGAGLVVLYAATLLWARRDRLGSDHRAWRRPVALGVGAIAAILITPYGGSIVGYYHSTMVDGTLRQYVSEWRPITTNTVLTAVLVLLAGLAVWSFGRAPARTTLWEKLALLVVAAGALEVMRNALFLGLLGLIVLPVALDWRPSGTSTTRTTRSADRVRARINATIAGLAAVALLAAAVATIARPAAAGLYARQSPGMVAAVGRATASDPSLRVLADDYYADFLLWRDPQLAGRLAADVRFELLTAPEVSVLAGGAEADGAAYVHLAAGDRLVALDRGFDAAGVRAFLAEPGARVLYEDPSQIVILRSAREATRA